MQNKYNQEEFEELVTKFMFYMELVFNSDWEYSKMCLQNMKSYIAENGSFLYPRVQNEGSDWGNRGDLLKLYRKLDDFIRKNNIRNREIDEYFSEKQDDNEKTDFILLAEKYFDEENEYPEASIGNLQILFERGYKLKEEDNIFILKNYNEFAKKSNENFGKWTLLRCIEKLNDTEKIVLVLKRVKVLFVILSLKFGKPIHFKFPNLLGTLNNAFDYYPQEGDLMLKAIKIYDREKEIAKLDERKGVFKRKIANYQKNKPIQNDNFVKNMEIIFPELKS